MRSTSQNFSSISEYIRTFPQSTQKILFKVYKTIKDAVPDAEEAIRYQMPTFRYKNKNLVHFAAYQNHIGFYPTPAAIHEFKEYLKKFKTSKGAIQFPITEEIPLDLISKIVIFRIKTII